MRCEYLLGAIGTVQGADLTIDMPSSCTLKEATVAVHAKIFASETPKVSIDRVRLRKFTHASAAGKTFGGLENKTLRELNFGLSCTMMLEVREEMKNLKSTIQMKCLCVLVNGTWSSVFRCRTHQRL